MTICKKFRDVVTIGSLAIAASPSVAAPVTFDLTGNLAPTSHSFQMTVDGVTALFEAFTFEQLSTRADTIIGSHTSISESNIGRYSEGVGVTNGWYDNHTVDSLRGNDFIQISLLTGALAITNVSFGFVHNRFDNFRWMWDQSGDGAIGGGDFISDAIDISANGGSFSGTTGQVSNVFGFSATNDSCGSWCQLPSFWKLESVTFDIAAVPLPATWLMLLGALGGLGLAKRRKTAYIK